MLVSVALGIKICKAAALVDKTNSINIAQEFLFGSVLSSNSMTITFTWASMARETVARDGFF
jgi:hypothetical protein